jgi:hypothetical protein
LLSKRPSLQKLLTILDIPFISQSFHTGGNDANYILRSLLMIAVSDSERENSLDEEQLALLGVMRGIAKSVVPTDRIKMSPVVQANGRLARLEAKARRKERRALKKQARENV